MQKSGKKLFIIIYLQSIMDIVMIDTKILLHYCLPAIDCILNASPRRASQGASAGMNIFNVNYLHVCLKDVICVEVDAVLIPSSSDLE